MPSGNLKTGTIPYDPALLAEIYALKEQFVEADDREIKFLEKPGVARSYAHGDKPVKALL